MIKSFLNKTICAAICSSVIFSSLSFATEAPEGSQISSAGVTATMLGGENVKEANIATGTALSGVSLAISDSLEDTQTIGSRSDAPLDGVFDGERTPFVEPERPTVDYASTAVSIADEYVNVRSEASEDSEALGKFYHSCVGTVTGTEGDWTRIQSGSIEGWVRNDFISVGNQALIDDAVQYHAEVTADALKLRSEMNTDCKVYSVARNGVKLDVLDDSTFDEGWIYIRKGDTDAYVSSDYVDMKYEFDYAESKEEEAARKALESTNVGEQAANYALQFVGNPYVWGGTSLTRGADCSGFVMSVMAKFGVYLPHSSAADRGMGYGVPINEMRAGDLVCYSGHVALCIGNGMIVHAASRRSGIKVSSAYYRKILCVRRVL